MKLLFDFFPIILFFISYYQSTFLVENTFIGQLVDTDLERSVTAAIVATGVALVANFFQIAFNQLKHRRIEKMHLFSFALFLVLGGTTIVLADPDFLKWKPTVLNWLFAAAFFGSFFVGEKTLIERAMGKQIQLPEAVWSRLNLAWVLFFITSGSANLYMAFYYGLELDNDTRMDHWVNFKLFGLMGLTILFVILQAIYLAQYMQDEKDDGPSEGANQEE
jgi:intracellular septation protein